jgi:hypothetical protein
VSGTAVLVALARGTWVSYGRTRSQWYRQSGAKRAKKPSDADGEVWQPDFGDPPYLKYWGELVAARQAIESPLFFSRSLQVNQQGYQEIID